MNKPDPGLRAPADDDLGPLDAHGQQVWSPEEADAIARLQADPHYQADIREGLASVMRGAGFSTEQVLAELSRRRASR